MLGIGLGIAFKGQNIVPHGLVLSIGASACLPIWLMSMFWSRLTTAGDGAGGATGMSLVDRAVVLGPVSGCRGWGHLAPVIPPVSPRSSPSRTDFW